MTLVISSEDAGFHTCFLESIISKGMHQWLARNGWRLPHYRKISNRGGNKRSNFPLLGLLFTTVISSISISAKTSPKSPVISLGKSIIDKASSRHHEKWNINVQTLLLLSVANLVILGQSPFHHPFRLENPLSRRTILRPEGKH